MGSAQSAQAPPANLRRRRATEIAKRSPCERSERMPAQELSPPETKTKPPNPASPETPDSAEARRAEPVRRSLLYASHLSLNSLRIHHGLPNLHRRERAQEPAHRS